MKEDISWGNEISSFHFSRFLKSMGENIANYHSFQEDHLQKTVVYYRNTKYTFLENSNDTSIQIVVDSPKKRDIYFSWDAFLKKQNSYFLDSYPLDFIC